MLHFIIAFSNIYCYCTLFSDLELQKQINSMIGENKVEEDIIEENKQQQPLIQSEHLEVYTQSFKNIKEKCELHSPKFSENNIEYNQERFSPFSYTIVQQIHSSEIIIIKVDIGAFRLQLKIYNSDRNSPLSRKNMAFEGNNGKVYTLQFISQRIAVKSYQISSRNSPYKVNTISKAIQEYCIMKICHALECGPYCPSYFGFDIVVFNDRIEFAMEECEKVSSPQLCFGGMLQLLGVMHRFKIMHMDINCSNIMYSPVRGKNIFIDFGYSSVISQDCGYKSLTSYKGTFEFVSGQMLELFSLDNSKGMIDLYYNDLVCLQTTDKYYRQQPKGFNKQLYQSSIDNQPEYQYVESQQSYDAKQASQEYLLILLKHEAYFNKPKVTTLLQQQEKVLIRANGRRTLQIFIQMLPSAFFEDIVFNSLKQLSKLDEYQQFSQISRIKKQKQLSYEHKAVSHNNLSTCDYLQRFILDNDQPFAEKKLNEDPIDFLIRRLESKSHQISAQKRIKHFEMILNCLRFDRKNFSLDKKKRLACAFLQLVNNVDIPENSEPLFPIGKAFDYLLQESLTMPITEQKNRLRFDLMVQAIMVDLDLSIHLLKFSTHIRSNAFGFMQLLQILYELYLMEGLYYMKNKLVNSIQTYNMIQKIGQEIDLLISALAQPDDKVNSCSNQQKISYIMTIIISSQRTKQPFYFKILSQIDNIEDKNIRAVVYKIIFIAQLSNTKSLNDYQQYNKLLSMGKAKFSEQIKINEDNFIQKIFWGIKILDSALLSTEHENLRKQVRQAINCDIVYESFVFKFFEREQLYTLTEVQSRQILEQIILACSKHRQVDYFCNQLRYCWNILKQNIQLRSSHMNLFQEMADIYIQYLQNVLSQYFAFPKTLTSQPTVRKKETNQYKFILKSQKYNRAINFLSFQGQLYFYLVNFEQPTEKHKQKYDLIVNKYFWKYLEAKAQDSQMSARYSKCVVIYYNMLRSRADYWRDLIKLLQFSRQMVALVYDAAIPSYLIKAALMHMIQIIKIIELKYPELKEQSEDYWLFIRKVLLWAWKFYTQQRYMNVYLLEYGDYELFSADTLIVLWQEQRESSYQFLEDMIHAVSKQPLEYFVFSFILNLASLDAHLPQFLDYRALKAKFAEIDRKNAYLIYCYGLCLKKCTETEKLQILREIRDKVGLVNWMCRQYILSFYYDQVIRMQLYGSENKRKSKGILRIVATKVHINNKQFQTPKLQIYLGCLKLKKTQNIFKVRLRNKLMIV